MTPDPPPSRPPDPTPRLDAKAPFQPTANLIRSLAALLVRIADRQAAVRKERDGREAG